jgi:hypothetical protein
MNGMARNMAENTKPLHEMTKREAVERVRSLYHAQPKADWDKLAVGNIILHKGYGWRVRHVPPKRGFVMAANMATGKAEKLLRSRYATPDLLVTDEAVIAVLKIPHEEEIKKAMAAGLNISPLVQYDYPELFTPYPKSWDEKRREKAQDIWGRINEMRAFHDRQEPPGWQFDRVACLIGQAKKEIVIQEKYRAECEAGVKITKPKAIPRIVASVNDKLRGLKEEITILRHLRKHLEKTVTRNRRKGRIQ